VDRWLRGRDGAGAVVEWPLGFPYDCEAMLRQADHGRPLVNGHQSYFPPAYRRLTEDANARPIPPGVWDQLAGLDARTLLFHPEQGDVYARVRYRGFIRDGLASGRIRLLHAAHDGPVPTFAFALNGDSSNGAAAPDDASRRELEAMMSVLDADLGPPTGVIHQPAEGQNVPAGFWVHGWAVDDTGIAGVDAATEEGPAGPVQRGTAWPGLEKFFPGFPGVERGGWGFVVPPLPPGPHTLRVTLVGRDGGRTLLQRRIVVTP
jgi:hypothetical protein